jgi:Ni,Fe-hydrogenase III large subunit
VSKESETQSTQQTTKRRTADASAFEWYKQYSPFEWCKAFHADLAKRGIEAGEPDEKALFPARLMQLEPDQWGAYAEIACRHKLRWVAAWGEDAGQQLILNACFEKQSDYLVVRTAVDAAHPQLPSQAPFYPAADRVERHIRDMLGVDFEGHPDNRRWTRHQAWPKESFPLRKEFPVAGEPAEVTPADKEYPFLTAKGTGVYEIPVGPVHAGIIEPGHFRFLAVGETVLNLEERLGYVHKGIEKIAEGRTPEALARLAGRVSGDTTVGHAWAACQAMERAAGVEIPARAAMIRAILAERERIANHLGDMGAICNDVGFTFAQIQFTRLRELWLRDNMDFFGHRLLMDQIIPGGIKNDLSEASVERIGRSIVRLKKEMGELVTVIDVNSSLEDRLFTTGVLTHETARALGVVGYLGRSSGQSFDLRRDAPYAPYDQLNVKVPVEPQGDVASRFWVRYKEIRVACQLISALLDKLPPGDLTCEWPTPTAGAEGLGLIEGWRGEILCYVRFGENNSIGRYYPRDPSVLNWPALEKIILENIVPDFPVCNKSLNGSYSGHDL